jgi:hypothetical protein
MAAAAPVAPGSGCLSRPRHRPPWVRLRGARVAAAAAAAAEGPSCLFVGPIETASQEKLEALYHQVHLPAFPSFSMPERSFFYTRLEDCSVLAGSIYVCIQISLRSAPATTIYMHHLLQARFRLFLLKFTSCQPLTCFSTL